MPPPPLIVPTNRRSSPTPLEALEDESPLWLWLRGAAPNGSIASSSGPDRFSLAQRTMAELKHEWIMRGLLSADAAAGSTGTRLAGAKSGAGSGGGGSRIPRPATAPNAPHSFSWVEHTLELFGFVDVVMRHPQHQSSAAMSPPLDADAAYVPVRAAEAARESVPVTAAAALLKAVAPSRHACPDSATAHARQLAASFTPTGHQQGRDPDADDDGGGRVSVLALGVAVLFAVAHECDALEETVAMVEPELRYLVRLQHEQALLAESSARHRCSRLRLGRGMFVARTGSAAPVSLEASVGRTVPKVAPAAAAAYGSPVGAERQYRRNTLSTALGILTLSSAGGGGGGATGTGRTSRRRQDGAGRGGRPVNQRDGDGSNSSRPLIAFAGSPASGPAATPSSINEGGGYLPGTMLHSLGGLGGNDSSSSAPASFGAGQYNPLHMHAGHHLHHHHQHYNHHQPTGSVHNGSLAGQASSQASPAGAFEQHHPLSSASQSLLLGDAAYPNGTAAARSARATLYPSMYGPSNATARYHFGGDSLVDVSTHGGATLAGAQSSLVSDGVAGSWKHLAAGLKFGGGGGRNGTASASTTPGLRPQLGPDGKLVASGTSHHSAMRTDVDAGDDDGRGGDCGGSVTTGGAESVFQSLPRGAASSSPGGDVPAPVVRNPMRPAALADVPQPPPTARAHASTTSVSSAHAALGESAEVQPPPTSARWRHEYVRQASAAATALLLCGRAAGPTTLLVRRCVLHASAAGEYRLESMPTILAAIAQEADEGAIGDDICRSQWYLGSAPGATVPPRLRERLSLPPEDYFAGIVFPPVAGAAGVSDVGLSILSTQGGATILGGGRTDDDRSTIRSPKNDTSARRRMMLLRAGGDGAAGSGGTIPIPLSASAAALGGGSGNHGPRGGGSRRHASRSDDSDADVNVAAAAEEEQSARTQPTTRTGAKYRVASRRRDDADLPPEERETGGCCAGGGCTVM